ncbi:hypothetical protein ACFX13_019577 [Malus domestica]
MAAMAEYQMIRDYQIRRNCKPRSYQKKGELIILKDPVVTFCVVCNAYVTLHCKNDKDDSGSHCPYECSVCLKFGHMDTHCPYQYHARKGAEVGHGGVLVCIYNKEGVHPGKDDWVGRAVVERGRIDMGSLGSQEFMVGWKKLLDRVGQGMSEDSRQVSEFNAAMAEEHGAGDRRMRQVDAGDKFQTEGAVNG